MQEPTAPGSRYCHIHEALQANGREQASAPVPLEAGPLASVAEIEPRVNVSAAENEQPDPFHAIAEAMSLAAEEIQVSEQGTETGHTEERSQSGALSKMVYSTSYLVGYGVAFPTFLAIGMLPMNHPLGRGMRDGAEAARQAVVHRREAREDGAKSDED